MFRLRNVNFYIGHKLLEFQTCTILLIIVLFDDKFYYYTLTYTGNKTVLTYRITCIDMYCFVIMPQQKEEMFV